ncbi:LamB/YcsF family protein [Campylobacter sp. MIT 99-7217]|uniref:LamB/YcsF family protein n=1 Tax=Campylobacter sp. MIT 99-7217 TaxID=535091 RepID=UPI001C8D9E2A|nr:5-oxoprolinase subunit PxpA [Campylobacter sp. MIT 99-7217]
MKVDLNSDLGEAFSIYKMGMDDEILQFVSSANVACGFHAGDPCVMAKTLELAKKYGVCIGAHPSYPDLLGFGRRNMYISFEEAKNYILYQLGALYAFAKANKMKISHLKLHGAFYNMANFDENLSLALCESIAEFDDNIIIMGLSGSLMGEIAKKKGLRYANEVFADRAYNDDVTLVSRKLAGAVIEDEDEAIERVVAMIKDHKTTSINGKEIDLEVDSICVHGDNVKALNFVKRIRKTLEQEGIKICPLEELV